MCWPNMAWPSGATTSPLAAARISPARPPTGPHTAERPRFAIGSMGPGTQTITVTASVTFEEVLEGYYRQAARPDRGRRRLPPARDLPGHAQRQGGGDRDPPGPGRGRGQPPPDGLRHHRADGHDARRARRRGALRLARAPGPALDRAQLRHRPRVHDRPPPLARRRSPRAASPACPNAGLPDEDGHYLETPEMLARKLRALRRGGLAQPGRAAAAARRRATSARSRELVSGQAPRASGRDRAPLRAARASTTSRSPTTCGPVIVGERTNVIGSRKFKELICRGEVRGGLGDRARPGQERRPDHRRLPRQPGPRRDRRTCERFLEFVIKKVRVPLMIDSTDAKVIELALTYCQGKAIINSINLEDGEERFEKVVPLREDVRRGAGRRLHRRGSSSRAWRVTRARKLEIAERSLRAAHREVRHPAPRTSTSTRSSSRARTGDEHYVGSRGRDHRGHPADQGSASRDARPCSASPTCRFGLPAAGREVLNSVFLYHCVQAGPRPAPSSTPRSSSATPRSPRRSSKLAEDLLWNRGARSGRRLRRALPRDARRSRRRARPRCRSTSGSRATSSRARKDGLIDDLELKL